jgi:hypothetical protein
MFSNLRLTKISIKFYLIFYIFQYLYELSINNIITVFIDPNNVNIVDFFDSYFRIILVIGSVHARISFM